MNLTLGEAKEKFKSGWWENKIAREIVDFQLYEDRLCCPFGIFHGALEQVLGRPVFTHEFADSKALREEYEGKREFDGVIPSFKRVAGGKPFFLFSPQTGKIYKTEDG